MLPRILAACAGAAIGAGLYASTSAWLAPVTWQTIHGRADSPGLSLSQPSTPVVDSTPVRLVIPAIGVDARVEARGLDSDRNLGTPGDFRDVAWYKLGPRPGEPGNAVLNGHVNWWTGDAVFTHLGRLRPGDQVRVVRADGLTLAFTVTSRRTVDANSRIAALFAPSTQSTMTLITCSGVWNPLTQSDTQRLLVSATLV